MVSFEFDAEAVLAHFREMERRASDLSPVMAKATEKIAEAIESNFATESEADGTPWDGLAELTKKERRKLGVGEAHPILDRFGTLKREAVSVREHDEESASVGAPDGHLSARALNDGHDYGNRVLPTRPFLTMSDVELDEIGQEIVDYIEGG